jgi:hypothetical protein
MLPLLKTVIYYLLLRERLQSFKGDELLIKVYKVICEQGSGNSLTLDLQEYFLLMLKKIAKYFLIIP